MYLAPDPYDGSGGRYVRMGLYDLPLTCKQRGGSTSREGGCLLLNSPAAYQALGGFEAVTAHASTRQDGSIFVLVMNKDSAPHDVLLRVTHGHGLKCGARYVLDEASFTETGVERREGTPIVNGLGSGEFAFTVPGRTIWKLLFAGEPSCGP